MKNKLIGIGILFVLLAIGTAMAFRGNFGTGQGFDSDKMEQIQTAIENGDYATWKQLHENNLTEENFNAIREKMQERTQARKEIQAKMQEIQTAIENQDYAAWKQLMEENNNQENEMMLSVITEDNFYLLSELHDEKASGDFEAVKAIMEELGIEKGDFRGKNRMHKGFGRKGNFAGNRPFANPSTE